MLTEEKKRGSADVLIAGAGPTGLVLALWLTKLGVRVRIIDKVAEPGTTSRALAVQARTLEFYQQIGLARTVVERGHKVPALNLWSRNKQAARAELQNLGQGLTPFSFLMIYPQDEHERLLIDRLREHSVEVERRVELTGFEDTGAGIQATIRGVDGVERVSSFAYLAGCDGAHSKVREGMHTDFSGGTYDHMFYVADVDAAGPPMNGELHVDLDDADFLAVFPLKGAGRARLIGSVRMDAAKDPRELRFEDVRDRAIQNLKIDVKHVNWFSSYRVHHRVAESFRKGRAFILGDAAHIHSPVGGQGMNTGIGDAVNLAWKLAAALRDPASSGLLDSYEPERIAFARRLVATTDRAFTGVISPSAMARFVRTEAVPKLLPGFFRVPQLRRLAFRTVSQIALNYRGSPLSAGKAGKVNGGDRLPWVRLDPRGVDSGNHTPLASLRWQIHIYGEAKSDLQTMCSTLRLPLHVFPWIEVMGNAGLARDAIYLIRPDGYVALADSDAKLKSVSAYLEKHALTNVAGFEAYVGFA